MKYLSITAGLLFMVSSAAFGQSPSDGNAPQLKALDASPQSQAAPAPQAPPAKLQATAPAPPVSTKGTSGNAPAAPQLKASGVKSSSEMKETPTEGDHR